MPESPKPPPDWSRAGETLPQPGCGELVEYVRGQAAAARRRHGSTGDDRIAATGPRPNLWRRLVRWWSARS